jgi:transcriptional regulator with XRE-family HTH domain
MARKPDAARLVARMRRMRGLSQRALARRARTTQAVVARIELGEASPSMETLARLARAAGCVLETKLRPAPVLDRQVLDDIPRILALSPTERLREVANISRFAASARRA